MIRRRGPPATGRRPRAAMGLPAPGVGRQGRGRRPASLEPNRGPHVWQIVALTLWHLRQDARTETTEDMATCRRFVALLRSKRLS